MMPGPLTAVEPGGDLADSLAGGDHHRRHRGLCAAFIAAILIGVVDTLGRVLLPVILRGFMGQAAADGAGPALASMMVYILMSLVLVVRLTGLFPPKG